MSNFYCEKCGIPVIDSNKGYIAGCKHYPPDIKPMKGFGITFDIEKRKTRSWYIDDYGTKRWSDNNSVCK